MGEAIDCREAKERLTDYLKLELTVELAVEVHEHLVRCRSCFGRAKFEDTLVQLLEARARKVTPPCPGAPGITPLHKRGLLSCQPAPTSATRR